MCYNNLMKKIAILYTEYSPTIDAIKYQLSDCTVDCITKPIEIDSYDLVVLSDYKNTYHGEALACHHSLLPAFTGENPEKQAIIEGAKVTGITVYSINPQRIIAQYPVFISNNMNLKELEQELQYVEQTIYPIVIEKVLKNEAFELRTLLNKKPSCCSGGCSSCSH